MLFRHKIFDVIPCFLNHCLGNLVDVLYEVSSLQAQVGLVHQDRSHQSNSVPEDFSDNLNHTLPEPANQELQDY